MRTYYDAERKEKNMRRDTASSAKATIMRQGSAAWRGNLDAGALVAPFLLIFAEPILTEKPARGCVQT
jgi:hypothetical protein